MPFTRRLLGYRRAEVDEAFAACRKQVADLQAEVGRLQKRDPFEAAGADIAGMVRELAEAARETKERGEREVGDIIAAAHAEADQIRAEAEAFAESLIDTMLHDFEPRMAEANAERDRLARALAEAQDAVSAALAAVDAAPELVLDLTVAPPEPVVDLTTNGNGHGVSNGASLGTSS